MGKDAENDRLRKANEKESKIYWHDAFYAALQLELHDYMDALTFEDERQLSKEALKIDVLVIKKKADVAINKNIGRIFRERNLFEYKSEHDYLSIWDYNKVIGYAMIYSAFEEVPIEAMTISFVVTPKPIKLFDYLELTKGCRIAEPHPGIYSVEGDSFPIQIIESKKLIAESNVFLKNLRSNLTRKDMVDVLQAYGKYGSLEKISIYLSRILAANTPIFKEVLDMSEAALQEVMYDFIKKNEQNIMPDYMKRSGMGDRFREEGKRDAALEMLKDGVAFEKIARYVQMPLEWVQSVAKQLK